MAGLMAVGELQPRIIDNYGYRSRFSHASEHAEPGYYAVHLDDPGAWSE